MHPADMNQSNFAAVEGLSAARVTCAFQASSTPEEVTSVFPSLSELSISDHNALPDVTERAPARGINAEKLAGKFRERIKSEAYGDRTDPAFKTKIISYFCAESAAPKKDRLAKKC